MTLFAKLSTYRRTLRAARRHRPDAAVDLACSRSATRWAKYMVATYSVGQLLWLRACAALLVLLPLIWRQRAEFPRLERPWLQLLRVMLSTLEVAAFFLATVYLPLADVITYYLACPIFVTALSAHRAARTSRLAALDRDPDRLLRRADRAAAVGADRELAGDDRARRQPVVCGADADHALAARDARYRAGVVAIRRHLPARRGDVAVRLGDADARQPRPVRARRAASRSARCSASTAR